MFVILGAGFTGSRVARQLETAGLNVRCTHRSSPLLESIDPGAIVLHSIPTFHTEAGLQEITPALTQAMLAKPPKRIVYLSTTGVYGPSPIVNEHSEPSPHTERERLRFRAERAVQQGPWSSLILRPAAIYGPGRGIHASMRAGTFKLSENPSNYVSRIHVDDLAALAYAALLSEVQGAYPVADEQPCTSLEAAQFCAELLGLSLPKSAPPAELGETRRADRRVDGSAIRTLLGVTLRYPSYKVGFPACLAAEMS